MDELELTEKIGWNCYENLEGDVVSPMVVGHDGAWEMEKKNGATVTRGLGEFYEAERGRDQQREQVTSYPFIADVHGGNGYK